MADVTISDLAGKSTPLSTDEVEIQATGGGTSNKATLDNLTKGLSAAGLTASGIVELATGAETNTGTDATRAVTPDGLDDWTGSAQITTVGTIASGTWSGDVILEAKLENQSGTNTGDEVAASTTAAGVVELATSAETNTGTDATRAVTPDGITDWEGSANLITAGTIGTGTWEGDVIAEAYLQNQSGTNTGDEVAADLTTAGVVELATGAETNTGTDATRAVTPDGLDDWTGSAQVTTLGTIATGVWNGTAINATYLVNQSGTNTGDEAAADLTTAGVVELATGAETNTGTDATRAVTPDGLDDWTGSAQVTTLGTIATGTWTGTDVAVAAGGTGASNAVDARTNLGLDTPLNTQTGTTYAVVLTDAGKMITMDNAGANTATLPANGSIAFPTGSEVSFMQLGTGATTIAITSDTLNVESSLTLVLAGRYAVATAKKVASTQWILFGNLTAS